jgi:serine/threonine protein kinase/tetratricopeptide (TPR) repeat protein
MGRTVAGAILGSEVPTAQDHALLALLSARGATQPLEQARALLGKAQQPLVQALLESRALPPAIVTELVRELTRATFACARCSDSRPYDALAGLPDLRCPRCKDVLLLQRSRDSRLYHSLDRAVPDATVRSAAPAPPSLKTSAVQRVAGAHDGPRLLGPYQLVSELGRGSNGVVYLAKRAGLERRFAVKVLLDPIVNDPEAVARFQLEAQVASGIEDEGVIAVYDVGIESGQHYYAMEFCPGTTLDERLRRGPLLPAEAAKTVSRLAKTVEAAHARGVIHRDLKPANVILEEGTGRPRILDFGMARQQSREGMSLTRSGDILGTPYYMAPEQISGAPDIDHRIDVYALGVVLYQCLTGRRPYEAQNVPELARRIRGEDPLPPRRIVPEIPEQLERVCLRAMARRREARYQSAGELHRELELIAGGSSDGAQLAPSPTPSSRGSSTGAGASSSTRAAAGRAGVLVASLAGVLALGSAAVAAVVVAGRPGPGATTATPPPSTTSAPPVTEPRAAVDPVAADEALRAARTHAERRARLPVVLAALDEAAAKASGDPVRTRRVELERVLFKARRGPADEAAAEAEPLLDAPAPEGPAAARARAWALERLRQVDAARAAWRALAERPDAPESLGHVARAAVARLAGDVPGAIQAARRALETEPQGVLPRIELAAALLAASRSTSTEPSKRDGVFREARDLLAGILEVAPDDPRVLLLVGLALLRSPSSAGDARAALDDAVGLAEPTPAPDALVARGTLARLARRVAPALADLDRALAASPDDAEGLLQRGAARLALAEAGDPAAATLRQEAADDWRRAWSQDRDRVLWALVNPESLEPATRLALRQAVGTAGYDPGKRLVEVGAEQRQRFEGWVRGVDEAARGPLLTALVGAAEGRTWAELEPAFAEARAAAPSSPVVATLRARVLVGRDVYAEGLLEIDRARKLDGPLSTLDRLEGELLWFRGDGPEAVKRWDALAARARERADGLCAAAWSHFARDADGEALAAADAALELEQGFAPAHLVRALTLRRLDRTDDALASLDAALALEGAILGRMLSFRASLELERQLQDESSTPGAARRLDAAFDALERTFPLGGATARTSAIMNALRIGPGWPGFSRTKGWLADAMRLEPERGELDVYDGVLRLIDRRPAEEVLGCWRRGQEKTPKLVVAEPYLDLFKRVHGDRGELERFKRR